MQGAFVCAYVCEYAPPLSPLQSLKERQFLPISAMAGEIVQAVLEHPVVIVRGNTGCGKTTQVPQFILDHSIAMGTGADCNIVVTQVCEFK